MSMPRKLNSAPVRLVSRLTSYLQRTSAYAQGKGYGTSTIKQEVKWVRKALGTTPALAVDIGGNVGDYTAELLRSAPGLEVRIFEPSPVNVEILTARFAAVDGVKVEPMGVSDTTGTATLYANRAGSGLGSLTKRRLDHFDIHFDHSDTVRTIRFEEYWSNALERRPVDIVKIDIEGHELAALAGFGASIESVGVLQFEFGGCNIDTRTYFQDFWYFFKQAGFDLHRITPFGLERVDRYRESDEIFSVTNFIAVNRRLDTAS
jgi:FkbM family methyltransferase